jgi:hypothetical protein
MPGWRGAFNHVTPGGDLERYIAASNFGARRAAADDYIAASNFGARRAAAHDYIAASNFGARRAAAHDYIAASNFGATSFLRLMTPGSSIELSVAWMPNVRATPFTSPATSRSVPLLSTSVTINA